MSTEQTKGLIWMDGKLVPWMEASVHPTSYTMQHGYGIFEGVRTYQTPQGPGIFRLEDHTNRLFKSASLIQMQIPYSKEELNRAQCDLIRQNRLSNGYIRPLVFYGALELGVHAIDQRSQVMIATWEIKIPPDAGLEKGLHFQISGFMRNSTKSVMSKAKATGNYLNSVLAYKACKRDGYDDAFMLDAQDHVSEATTSNIFIVKNNVLYTPTTFSILEGITRATVMVLAPELGYPVIEKDLSRDDLYTADEVFVTGTMSEIKAVTEIDRRLIGDGARGPITRKIYEKYRNVVTGNDPNHIDWLTIINQ